jgi:UDP-N-acetylglucosamine 2-epimerase
VLSFAERARARSRILDQLELTSRGYLLATVHRAYNTDDNATLESMIDVLGALDVPVVFPVHPRTKARLAGKNKYSADLRMIEPVGYLDMLMLEQNARMVLTDSGGMQKEAYFFEVPCVTLRPETEWTETVEAGWNVVAGTDPANIRRVVKSTQWPSTKPPRVFGDGRAAARIVSALSQLPGR